MKNSFIVGLSLLASYKVSAAIQKSNEVKVDPVKPVVVAVVDTGIDIHHRGLRDFIWTNPGETGLDIWGNDKSTNKLDDDGNGFADDIHGWNFINNNNDLLDSMGHGTHISGVIKSESSKSPLSKERLPIKIMALKYYDPEASDAQNIENTVKAINYAVKMRADVINYSGGGSLPNRSEMIAIQNANINRILFIAAAGNNKRNTDVMNYFPANYKLPNIISVAATDNYGDLTTFSNYGQNSIDIAAPGKNIFSTLPGNKYGYLSGTSQATAFVTGVVALKIAESRSYKESQKIRSFLLREGQFNKSLVGKTRYRLALITKP